jgi:hypothetical protein
MARIMPRRESQPRVYNRDQMRFPSGSDRDVSWFLLAAAILVLASPLRYLWAGDGRPWYLPLLVWLGIIVAVRLVDWVRGSGRDGRDGDR